MSICAKKRVESLAFHFLDFSSAAPLWQIFGLVPTMPYRRLHIGRPRDGTGVQALFRTGFCTTDLPIRTCARGRFTVDLVRVDTFSAGK